MLKMAHRGTRVVYRRRAITTSMLRDYCGHRASAGSNSCSTAVHPCHRRRAQAARYRTAISFDAVVLYHRWLALSGRCHAYEAMMLKLNIV